MSETTLFHATFVEPVNLFHVFIWLAVCWSRIPVQSHRYILKGGRTLSIFRLVCSLLNLSFCLSLGFSALRTELAFAAEILPPVRELKGLRSLGLGFPAVALSGQSNGESPIQNPAWTGLESKARQKATLRGVWVPGVTVGANATTGHLAKAYFAGNGSTQKSLENFLTEAKNQQTPYGFFELYPSFGLGFLQWGLFARVRVEGYVWQPSSQVQTTAEGSAGTLPVSGRIGIDPFSLTETAQMDVCASVQRGTSLSFSIPYKNTGVTLGATARPTWRSDYSGTVALAEPLRTDAAKDLRARFNETHGIPVDAAMTIRLPQLRMKPSVGFKWDDLGDTIYNAANSSHQSLVEKSSLSAGAAAWMFQSKSLSAQCSVAGHHLNDTRIKKSSAFGGGCEFYLMGQTEVDAVAESPLILRMGGNSDGLAYGLSWDMPFAVLEIASNVGSVEGPVGYSARKDRRYFLRFTVDASQP
ncbi:hypothetical protein EBU99_12605 [bacterium]|nr:hypothetical protein [bacterium]